MRTVIIILGGFLLWAICIGIARLAANSQSSSATATMVFAVLWFATAACNMWIGVSRAGYTFWEELPIFLVIFLLPTAVALFVKWKFL